MFNQTHEMSFNIQTTSNGFIVSTPSVLDCSGFIVCFKKWDSVLKFLAKLEVDHNRIGYSLNDINKWSKEIE